METAKDYFERKYPDVDDENAVEEASNLVKTMRGSFILGQALHYGIKTMMEKDAPERREKSNIADMYLLTTLFFPFSEMEEKEIT